MIGRSALLFSRYHSFMLLGKLLLHIRLYPGNPLLNGGIRQCSVLMVFIAYMGYLLLAGGEAVITFTDDTVDVAHDNISKAHADRELSDSDTSQRHRHR